MKKGSKKEAEKRISDFFSDSKSKTSKGVKKIKTSAMAHGIKLGSLRKAFCRKCLNPYSGKEKVRIRSKVKSIVCDKCGSVSRWKIK